MRAPVLIVLAALLSSCTPPMANVTTAGQPTPAISPAAASPVSPIADYAVVPLHVELTGTPLADHAVSVVQVLTGTVLPVMTTPVPGVPAVIAARPPVTDASGNCTLLVCGVGDAPLRFIAVKGNSHLEVTVVSPAAQVLNTPKANTVIFPSRSLATADAQTATPVASMALTPDDAAAQGLLPGDASNSSRGNEKNSIISQWLDGLIAQGLLAEGDRPSWMTCTLDSASTVKSQFLAFFYQLSGQNSQSGFDAAAWYDAHLKAEVDQALAASQDVAKAIGGDDTRESGLNTLYKKDAIGGITLGYVVKQVVEMIVARPTSSFNESPPRIDATFTGLDLSVSDRTITRGVNSVTLPDNPEDVVANYESVKRQLSNDTHRDRPSTPTPTPGTATINLW